MDNLKIGEKMYQTAVELIQHRYPTGWGGAAVIRTEDDSYYTSVAIETANGGAQLCIEVGAMCEAHKFNTKVTHSLCVVRDDENSPFKVLTACGICQERLRFWGTDVFVGVTDAQNTLKFVTLDELQPFHWSSAYPQSELEHYVK